jgi:hypothetical protein
VTSAAPNGAPAWLPQPDILDRCVPDHPSRHLSANSGAVRDIQPWEVIGSSVWNGLHGSAAWRQARLRNVAEAWGRRAKFMSAYPQRPDGGC